MLLRVFDFLEEIAYTDMRYTLSTDGKTVFFECKGQMILSSNGQAYNNTYIFRLDFDRYGKIAKLIEYFDSYYVKQTIDLSDAESKDEE